MPLAGDIAQDRAAAAGDRQAPSVELLPHGRLYRSLVRFGNSLVAHIAKGYGTAASPAASERCIENSSNTGE